MPSKITHEINKLRGETEDTGEVFISTMKELQDAIDASESNIADLDSETVVLDSKFRKQELQILKVHNLVKKAMYDIKNYGIKNIIASDTLIHSNPSVKTHSSVGFEKVKETLFHGYSGIARISYEAKESGGGGCIAQIYINGVSVTNNQALTTSYATYSNDKIITSGDLIQIYTADAAEPQTASVKNLNISGTITDISQTSQDP